MTTPLQARAREAVQLRAELIDALLEQGFDAIQYPLLVEKLHGIALAFAATVREEERERGAKIAENNAVAIQYGLSVAAIKREIAAAIREGTG